MAKKTAKKKPAPKKPAKKKSPAKKAAAPKKIPAKKTVAKTTVKAKATAKKQDASYELAHAVVNGMLEKKAEKIVCLDLRKIGNAVTDFFIICEGNSNVQVEAIADSVEETVKKEKQQRPYRSEGWENALWILIDYVNVVVHVFERETRYFYNLESLWADAEEVHFPGTKRG